MQKKGANISLKGYDDIFSTDQSRAESQQERVQEIPLSELHPFEGHPFRVVDDEEMMKTAESVRDFGVLTPAIVRPDPDGGYEIVSGHRRHRASELAGKETMPAIVRDLDDDAAIILMVDANLQRETILPSERAFAYKMKLDAIKHQGERTDLTSAQVGQKSWAVNQVAEQSGDSRVQVQRYIRLTELIPELLDMVDGEIDWFRFMLVYGVPVGIPHMFIIIPWHWDLSGILGMVALCVIVGGIFGCVIAAWLGIRAVWYMVGFPISKIVAIHKRTC